MKVKKIHLQLAIGALVVAVLWSAWSFYRSSRSAVIAPAGPAAQAPLLVRDQPMPSQPTQPVIDPISIPAPPSIEGAFESASNRDPFLFGSEDRNVPDVIVPAGANPTVRAILFAASRRLAIVENRVVRVGDRVGDFTVVQIERDAVTFGLQTGERRRVSIRGQMPGGAGQ